MGNKTYANKKNIKRTNRKKNNVKDKSIYIVISKTSTLPSNVIKMWTKEPYAHTSLSFDIELNDMYSFARRKLHNPFYCGFIKEDITTGVFGRDVDTTCRVARLKVSSNSYKKMRKMINEFKKHDMDYKYNYLGIVGIMFNKAVEREYNYFCSQFVYHVLEKSVADTFDKKAGLVRPEDFRQWDKLELIYEGKLKDYRQYLKDNNITEESNKEYFSECMIKNLAQKAAMVL